MGDEAHIAHSARRHGIEDADIEHALRHYLATAEVDVNDQDEARRVLLLGPSRSGNLLEIVLVERDDGSAIVIHAMKMRPAFRGLLPGREDR